MTKKNHYKLYLGLVAVVITSIAIGLVYFNNDQDYFDVQSSTYTQTGNFYELLNEFALVDSTFGQCKEYLKLYSYYSGGWHEVSTANTLIFNPIKNELVDRNSGSKIVNFKLNTFLNCDLTSQISSAYVSGPQTLNFYDKSPSDVGFKLITTATPITTSIPSKKMGDSINNLLSTTTFDAQSLQNKLTLRSDNTVQFTVTSDTRLTFAVTGTDGKVWTSKQPSSVIGSTLISYRMGVSITNDPAPPPTVATSRDETLEITKFYQSINPNVSPITKLDSSLTSGRQVTLEVKMSKYVTGEGSPMIEVKKPNGQVYLKVNTSVLRTESADQIFFTRITIPQDGDVGNWIFKASNINRNNISSKTLSVFKSTTAISPTATCASLNANQNICLSDAEFKSGGVCYQKSLSECVVILNNGGVTCPAGTTCPTTPPTSPLPEPTIGDVVQNANIGLVWEIIGFGDETINNGDSRTQGYFGISDLKAQELVSTTENKDGTQKAFKQINISPHLLFVEGGAVDPTKSQNYNIFSSNIKADLTVVGKDNSKAITRSIIPSTVIQTTGGISMPLGMLTISRENIEELASQSDVKKGSFFEVIANLKGDFTITDKKTNKSYLGKVEGTTFTQEFKYGLTQNEQTNKDNESKEDGGDTTSSDGSDNPLCQLLGYCPEPEAKETSGLDPEPCQGLSGEAFLTCKGVNINDLKNPQINNGKGGVCNSISCTLEDIDLGGIATTDILLIVGILAVVVIVVVAIKKRK